MSQNAISFQFTLFLCILTRLGPGNTIIIPPPGLQRVLNYTWGNFSGTFELSHEQTIQLILKRIEPRPFPHFTVLLSGWSLGVLQSFPVLSLKHVPLTKNGKALGNFPPLFDASTRSEKRAKIFLRLALAIFPRAKFMNLSQQKCSR